MRRISRIVLLPVIVAVVLLAPGLAAPAAGAQACGVAIAISIANGGFEEPALAPGDIDVGVLALPGWAMTGAEVLWGPGPTFVSGSQFIDLFSSVSQSLDGTTLAGTTVTFSIISRQSGTIALGDQSQAVTGSAVEQTHTVSFDVPANAPANLVLTLTGGSAGWEIDQISGSYVVPCGPVVPPGCVDAVNGGGPFAGAEVIFVTGGSANGGAGSQVIVGTAGPDWISAGSGNDLVCGGGGNDTIVAGSGDDVVYGDEGDDELTGGSGSDTLDGGEGANSCQGGSGSNTIVNCEG